MATGVKISMTNDELVTLRGACQSYINQHPESSPFHHALMRTLKQTKAAHEDYDDGLSEIRVKYALIDKTTGKFVLNDDKQTNAIDPAQATKMQQESRALSRAVVEVEIYQATLIPTDLKSGWIQQFAGNVIKDSMIKDGVIVKEEVKNGKEASKKLAVAE